MLTFYRPVKWALPALARKKDLLLLDEVQGIQSPDKKGAKKLWRLVHDFHQINYMCTIGAVAGLLATIFFFYMGFDDLIHPTKDTMISAILICSAIAIIPFCGLVRLFGMWSVRRKYQKLKQKILF